VQVPRVLVAVAHADPVVLGDHVAVQRQDRLLTHRQPRYLPKNSLGVSFTIENLPLKVIFRILLYFKQEHSKRLF